jgi:cytochrome c
LEIGMTLRPGKLLGLPLAIAMATPLWAAPAPKPAAFAMCGVCHKVAAGEKPTIGPNLFGVGGRKAGSAPGFSYSPAMSKAKFNWTRPQLIAFITSPQQVVPGTKMAFAGQKNPQTAAAIADYLLSLK